MPQTLTPEEGRALASYVHFVANYLETPVAAPPTAPIDTPQRKAPDYYFVRKIARRDHALRYMDENPIAAMRLSDPTRRPASTPSDYELTDEERAKAGEQRLPDTRHHRLHLADRLNEARRHDGRYGTPADRCRHGARSDAEIMELLEPFCALCDGAGMSFRTIRKHPHVHWERYQKAGLRISSDRAFETTSLCALRARHRLSFIGSTWRTSSGLLTSHPEGIPRRRFQRSCPRARPCAD